MKNKQLISLVIVVLIIALVIIALIIRNSNAVTSEGNIANVNEIVNEIQETNEIPNVVTNIAEDANKTQENIVLESSEEKQQKAIVKSDAKKTSTISNTKTTIQKTEKKQIKKDTEDKEKTKKTEKIEKTVKSIYDYKFNITQIRSELIRLGESMGLKHKTMDDGQKITPHNSSWANPITASQTFQGERLERALKDYVKSMPEVITNYGGEKIDNFTIYVENRNNGTYTFYFLY